MASCVNSQASLLRLLRLRNRQGKPGSGDKVGASPSVRSIHDVFDGYRLEGYPPRQADHQAATRIKRERVGYGSGLGIPDVTDAGKDERRISRFVAECVEGAKKLYVDILVLAVKVREVGGHADLFIDIEGWQHVPTVGTCPITGRSFGGLVDIPGPYGTPLLGETRPG